MRHMVEPPSEVGQVLPDGFIYDESEGEGDETGHLNVCDGQVSAYHEVRCLQVLIQYVESDHQLLVSTAARLDVNWVVAQDGDDQAGEYGFHFS